MEIRNRNAFVTGGASGIGLALCLALAAAGANVAIADVNQVRLDEATKRIAAMGVRSCGIQLDVTDREALTFHTLITDRA
jgi:NAD(P)-dependent dehydrogenase (short-subunit alcohol dehydrogenase family)